MKKKIIILMVALCCGIICAVGIAVSANIGDKNVDSIISDMGIGTTIYDPPEILELNVDELHYQYTAEIGSEGTVMPVNNVESIRTSYWYSSNNGDTYIYDSNGRLTGYMNHSDIATFGVNQLSEVNCISQAEAFAEEMGMDLSQFSDVQYQGTIIGADLEYTKDVDTIYASTIRFQFTQDGVLNSMSSLYSDIESLSESDYEWLAAQVENYIMTSQFAGLEHKTIFEQCYALNGVLYYQASVAFTYESGTESVEVFTSGKPLV